MTTNLSTQIRPGTYSIDLTRSTCTLVATHAFGLKPVTATVAVGGGTVTVGTDPAACSASAHLDAATFTSDDPRRNKDVRGKRFLDAESFPAIGFRSTGCTPRELTGVLSVRGTDSEVTLQLGDVSRTAGGYRCTASCTIDRVTAGVKGGRGIIARPVRITLDIHLTA
jgi:polyisoprenoid-binding protein YceI